MAHNSALQPDIRHMDARTVTSLALPTPCPPFPLALAAPRCNWYMFAITYIAVFHCPFCAREIFVKTGNNTNCLIHSMSYTFNIVTFVNQSIVSYTFCAAPYHSHSLQRFVSSSSCVKQIACHIVIGLEPHVHFPSNACVRRRRINAVLPF